MTFRSPLKPFLACVLGAALAVSVALAQDGRDKSRFVQLIEGLISTADRQVTLTGLEGAFSSHPTIARITVSDREGPWLTLDGVDATWNRAALFRRRLDIANLQAKQVTVLRRPVAGEAAAVDGGGSALPVEVTIDGFRLHEITLASPVAGTEGRLTAEGSAQLTGDMVAAQLAIERLDRPGTLSADLRLQPADNLFTADLQVTEPAGGMVADLLGLRGRPEISFTLAGTGPLAAWRADVVMQAGAAQVLTGGVAVSRESNGYRISADLVGALEAVAPENYAAFLGGESRLAFNVLRGDDGAIEVQSAALKSRGADIGAAGRLTADLVPESADVTVKLGQAGRTGIPFAPGQISVASLEATIGLNAGAEAPWRADIVAQGVESTFGAVRGVAFAASGQARDLASPTDRATSFRVEASAEGVAALDADLAASLGPSLRVTGAGAWAAGQPVTVESIQAILSGATASFSGAATIAELNGRFGVSATDLSRYAALLGRPLSGSLQAQAEGIVTPATGAFDLRIEGEGGSLGFGVAALDPLLSGTTRLDGGIARRDEGLAFEALTLANDKVTAELTGSFADPVIDLALTAEIADLSAVNARAAGQARLTARVIGTTAAPEITAEASGIDVTLMGRALADASARFSGVVAGPRTGGQAELSGAFGGVPVRGTARLAAGDGGARTIDDLLLTVGESRLAGDLSVGADGLLTGQIGIVSPDLSKVAPLFLVEAGGMVKADVSLGADGGVQSTRFAGTATDIVYEALTLDSVELSGEGRNLFTAPQVDGAFTVRNLKAGGLTVVSARGTAARQGDATVLSADAELADGRVRLSATLRPQGDGIAVALQDFAFARAGVDLGLSAPATITVGDGKARFAPTTLTAGGGSITLAGSAGSTLDLTARLTAIPAALANAFVADLGAEGSISGTAMVTGPATAPAARFDATWQSASVAASRNAGLGSLAVSAQGSLADNAIDLTSRITGADGLAIAVAGTLGATAGAPLDLGITGAVPLSLGNSRLASRGAALQGALSLDISVGGTAAAPRFAGRVTSEGGGFVDPETGIVLRNLSLAASVSNNRLVVDRLTAQSGEGSVSGSGSIGLDNGFPVDLAAQIRQARYVDGTLVSARFDADLTITGSLAAGPVLGGTVFLDRTEVTVPEQLPQGSVAVDVEHVNESPAVDEMLARARNRSGGSSSASGGTASGGLALDLTIRAPQQIFVRGRGLDAELGGELRVTGRTSALIADGAFEMDRGRLDIFTQRITFDRGVVTFAGDLDPLLDFAGTTKSGEFAITVAVAGQASDPEVTFSSVPELPQDEVLAHLIFERGIGELSPVQIARLADAAAQLSGATGGNGLLGQLRASTGLDDLDIVTDDEGAPAVAAGRYVSENVYIGVQQGASAESSRVTIDLDITDDVKARAAVTPQGNSSLGVFFEREY